MSEDKQTSFTNREALFYHETIRPGKIEIVPSKPMATQRQIACLLYTSPSPRD